jgi:NAD(P)-dependent dehydrogenase (short-subunit alcohol dehydrogenase family)
MSKPSTIIVTGVSRGLGLAITKNLLEKGFHVVGIARSNTNLSNDRFTFVQGDVCDVQVQERALDHVDSLQAIIHNAGILDPLAQIADFDKNDWNKAMEVNLFAPLSLTALALPKMVPNGNIVFISSGAAVNGYVGWGAYCSTKSALLLAGKCLAKENPNVRVLSIRPGVVDTEMQTQIRSSKVMGEDLNKFIALKENGKLLSPEVVGSAIALVAVRNLPITLSGDLIDWTDTRLLE